MKNLSVRTMLFRSDRRTDLTQTDMTKLVVAFPKILRTRAKLQRDITYQYIC